MGTTFMFDGCMLGKCWNAYNKRQVLQILTWSEIHRDNKPVWCAIKVGILKAYDSIEWDFVLLS